MICLAIETSCDETAVALLNGPTLLAEKVASQIKAHQKYGGIMPECASRLHTEVLQPLVQEVIAQANCKFSDLECIAVTYGPGLEGSLLIGLAAAKSMASCLNIPVIGINHLHGHVFSAFENKQPHYPLLALIVSGGHTQLVRVDDALHFKILGQTRDDACGEAFDKVARLLGLTYPGGPEIERIAKQSKHPIQWPRPMIHQGLDFSFSGLKTAVSQWLSKQDPQSVKLEDVAAGFQEAVTDVLLTKTERAFNVLAEQNIFPKQLVCCGGVFANQAISSAFRNKFENTSIEYLEPRLALCGDNAVMIALACYYQFTKHNKNLKACLRPIQVSPGLAICD